MNNIKKCKKIVINWSRAGENGILKYPDVSSFSHYQKFNGYGAVRITMKKLQKVKDEEEIENGINELFLDFRQDKKGELIVKLKDKTKGSEEVKNRVKETDKNFPNIITLFIDTVSRQEFYRKYKKTVEFLEKYHYSKNKKTQSFEFTKLHSILPYTFPNLFASNYGLKRQKIREWNLKRIDSYFRSKGYITGFASDSCFLAEDNTECKKTQNIFFNFSFKLSSERRVKISRSNNP